MNRTRNVCLSLACLAIVGTASARSVPASQPASAPREHVISGKSPTFTLRVPGEFTPAEPAIDGVTHAYYHERDGVRILLDVIPYYTEFRKRPLDKTFDAPADRTVKLPWRDTTVTVYEILKHEDGREIVFLFAAVPTVDNGLVLRLAGPRERAGDMASLLPTLLETLDASPESTGRGDTIRKATLLSIVGMLIIIATLRRHQVMRKRRDQADEARRRAAWGDGPSQ